MTTTEALKILGLWPTDEQVRSAFAKQCKRYHPDTTTQAMKNLREHRVSGDPVQTIPSMAGLKQARDVLLPKNNSTPQNPCVVCKGSGRVLMRECSSCRGTGDKI